MTPLSYCAQVINARSFVGVVSAVVGASMTLIGCASNGASHTAPASSPRSRHFPFHEPTTASDAAAEFVRALATGQVDVTDRLTCLERPSYGSWPLIFFRHPVERSSLRFDVTDVHRTDASTWRVTVRPRFGEAPAGFRAFTTVVKESDHYRVCTVKTG